MNLKVFNSFFTKEKVFLFHALLCGFLICCGYSIVRPVSNSLFIDAYSASFLPYVWIATIPFNWLIVSLYNRLIPKWGTKKVFFSFVMLVMGLNAVFAVFCKKFPALSFPLYIWKEIYVMLFFQMVWSVIHTNVAFNKAKYLYGIFFGVGALGSLIGSAFPGFFAIAYGSENIIFWSLPVALLLLGSYLKMLKMSVGDVPEASRDKEGGFMHGVKLIASSRFLIFALLMVVFMQMSVAIADFQFNHYLERAFSEKDVRTEYTGRVFGIVQTFALIIQFLGTFLLIQWMGFKKAHYLLPTILGASASLLAAFPSFNMVSLSFITCKTMDFSLFNIVKEMLYIPLKTDEKFRAKAVIDVFAYRSSKALASLLILGLQLTSLNMMPILTGTSIAIAVLWIGSVAFGLRSYEKLTSPKEAT